MYEVLCTLRNPALPDTGPHRDQIRTVKMPWLCRNPLTHQVLWLAHRVAEGEASGAHAMDAQAAVLREGAEGGCCRSHAMRKLRGCPSDAQLLVVRRQAVSSVSKNHT
jgi:hypothetical protein